MVQVTSPWLQSEDQLGTINDNCHAVTVMCSGPRLNIKTVLSTYGDFHVKDKTAVRTSYL